jgi:hypothetical protein
MIKKVSFNYLIYYVPKSSTEPTKILENKVLLALIVVIKE